MLVYGLLWTVGWLLAGWFVRRSTGPGSRDRKLRPLAYVCFAVAAVPAVVWLAYFVAFSLFPGGDFTAF